MKKALIIFMATFSCLGIAIAKYVKSTFIPFPEMSELDQYVVCVSDSYNHLFDTKSDTLEDLLETSNVVALVEAVDEGSFAELSIRRKIHILETIKGNPAEEAIYYEPVIVDGNKRMTLLYGYLPMIKGNTYLLFMRETPHEDGDEIEYYPVSADLGKYEYGKQSYIHEEEMLYSQVKNDALYALDYHTIFTDMQQRNEIYNKIYDEIKERGLFK